MPIPKMFHRIWLDEPVPDKFEGFWRRFQGLHPDWDFLTWDDSSALGFMRNPNLFNLATTHAGRADILRYELMWRFGGVYVDTDVEPLRPFDDLLEDERPFAALESGRLICPTVLGSPPEHPAYDELLNFLPKWMPRWDQSKPNIATGPHPFTHIMQRRQDFRTLPKVTFYPVGWWERDRLGEPYPEESYCVHHWNQGWDVEAKQRIDARQPSRLGGG